MNMVDHEPHIHGVLVTFRRPGQLRTMLSAIAGQERTVDSLVVVDNDPSSANEDAVRGQFRDARYLPAPENLGPAGGLAEGMSGILEAARSSDWILALDDDDPPFDPRIFATLSDFATQQAARDPAVGGVGLSGIRFDRRAGRMVRIPDHELHGPVPVDCLGGNQFPFYSVAAIREVGPPRRDLFFGLEELELGLRLRDAGYSLYGHGALWHATRVAGGRLGMPFAPDVAVTQATWRRYYSLRNLIVILRATGRSRTAMKVTLVAGMAKPLVNLPLRPRPALRNFRLNRKACWDAWTGRMGRTVEPDAV